jgi:hypothetical protein
MNLFIKTSILIIMVLSISCESHKGLPKFIPGYVNPGSFRPTPMPVAHPRQYTLFNGAAYQQSCTALQKCIAVYTYWITEDKVMTEGIAIDDKALHPTNPMLSLKIYRAAFSPWWGVYVTINGASYSGLMDANAITITKQTETVTMPIYGTEYPDPYDATIKTATIVFNQDVWVCNGGACIRFNIGDTIIANDSSWFF